MTVELGSMEAISPGKAALMKILRAYKTELDPPNGLRTLLLKHAGARRWAYNWGLQGKIEEYERTRNSPHAQATVTERAGRWFVSLQVERELEKVLPKEATGGVDVGISALATLSDGETIENPRTLQGAERKFKRLQRSVSRKRKGSKNRQKAVRSWQRPTPMW